MSKLLTREEFKAAVFKRDGGKCVFCDRPGVDAHHIIERRLWPDGGYYVDNGATVCAEHHMECEKTTLTVEAVREACGITKKVIPPHFYDDHVYDKWGNIILDNGTRLKGELFFDSSVQKVLAAGAKLALFESYVKYPRTHHVPWSPGMHDDDRISDMKAFLTGYAPMQIVVTEKMDGENTSMYHDYIHARSINSRHHESQAYVKNFWSSNIRGIIPPGWRVCAENLYAKHSIPYPDLSSYVQGFSIWDERNVCLSWSDTLDWFELLGITPVRTLYVGPYDESELRKIESTLDTSKVEGYVIRPFDAFAYGQFRTHVAKYVRKDHIRTVQHWKHGQEVIKNVLKNQV